MQFATPTKITLCHGLFFLDYVPFLNLRLVLELSIVWQNSCMGHTELSICLRFLKTKTKTKQQQQQQKKRISLPMWSVQLTTQKMVWLGIFWFFSATNISEKNALGKSCSSCSKRQNFVPANLQCDPQDIHIIGSVWLLVKERIERNPSKTHSTGVDRDLESAKRQDVKNQNHSKTESIFITKNPGGSQPAFTNKPQSWT